MALAKGGLYNLKEPFPRFHAGALLKGNHSPMPKVVFIKGKDKQEIDVPDGAVLRDAALKAGIQVNYFPVELGNGFLGRYLNCHGLGHCGTCKVLVKKGKENLNDKTMMEKINMNLHPLTMLATIGHEDEMRLSCQVTVNGDCTIETTPGINWSGENFWQKPYPNK